MKVWSAAMSVASLLLLVDGSEICRESCDGCRGACSFCRENGVTTLCLDGSMEQMGADYGRLLRSELAESFILLENHFGDEASMYKEALLFDDRYSSTFRSFLRGISLGSGLTMKQILILNAMETLTKSESEKPKQGSLKTSCLFAHVPPAYTKANRSIFLRNYDFPTPFNLISKNLVVAIVKQQDKIPTAIIGMPGQIYCPTCVNKFGLFLELNNGMPSGGFLTNYDRKTMLINMLEYMQDSETLGDLSKSLRASQSDYSLVLNSGSTSGVASHEFSSFNGSLELGVDAGVPFVSTNFFLSPAWPKPRPGNLESWWGILRRDNMLRLLADSRGHGLASLEGVMDVGMIVGGSKWSLTIYQLIFEPESMRLAIRSLADGRWTHIHLGRWL